MERGLCPAPFLGEGTTERNASPGTRERGDKNSEKKELMTHSPRGEMIPTDEEAKRKKGGLTIIQMVKKKRVKSNPQ